MRRHVAPMLISVMLFGIMLNGIAGGYTSHDVIRIDSNADFDSSHGVVGRNGQKTTPT